MLAHLADVSIRSLVLAGVAMLVLWIAGRRRTAAWEHAVWTTVMCGMLLLFAAGAALPQLPLRLLQTSAVAVESIAPPALTEVTAEHTGTGKRPATAARTQVHWSDLALGFYALVAIFFLARLATGILLVSRLRGNILEGGFYESEQVAIPVTVGWLRPRILLPTEWRQWERAKLDAVLAHEEAHVQRRDGLVAALAELNKCIFWFHPLSWLLEKRLALLAEQACDDCSVAALGNRERYATLLLEMALVVDRSKGRLALTMAAGSHIRQRIDSILEEGRTFSKGLSGTAWSAMVLCAIPLIFAAGEVTLAHAAPQAPSAPKPKFEVASIKPCDASSQPVIADGGRGKGGKSRGISRSPGKLNINCMNVWEIVDIAYAQFGEPLVNASTMPFDQDRLKGGPGWIHSQQYTIHAESEDPVAKGPTTGFKSPAFRLMTGPMLQSLLEDRFQLKLHRDVQEVPMYALTVAKGGLKIKPVTEGDCIPNGSPEWPKGGKPACNWIGWDVNGPNKLLLAGGIPLSFLASSLGEVFMDRHVVDRTGVTGNFNIRIEYAPDETTPGRIPGPGNEPAALTSDIPLGVSMFSALQQELGLKLESIKGPRGILVIDRVERPTEN